MSSLLEIQHDENDGGETQIEESTSHHQHHHVEKEEEEEDDDHQEEQDINEEHQQVNKRTPSNHQPVSHSISDEKNLRSFRIEHGSNNTNTTNSSKFMNAPPPPPSYSTAVTSLATTSTTASGSTQQQQQQQQSQNVPSQSQSHHHHHHHHGGVATQLTQHQLIVRFKAVVKDVAALALANRDEGMCEHFILLADEAAKAFRGAKSDIRVTRHSPGGMMMQRSATSSTKQHIDPTTTSLSSSTNTETPPRPRGAGTGNQRIGSPQPSTTSTSNNTSSSSSSAANSGKGRSYAAALTGKQNSPQKATTRSHSQPESQSQQQQQQQQPQQVSDALPVNAPNFADLGDGGAVDALGSSTVGLEEKQAEAEGRRKLIMSERHRKFEEQAERQALVKVRREQALERTRTETREKAEKAEKLRLEASHRKKEFSSRDLERVDEVGTLNALHRDTKQVDLEVRQKQNDENLEQRRKTEALALKERAEAHEAVIHRAADLEKEKREKQEQRIQQKEEAAKRLEEQRKHENELKKQRQEDRERRVAEEKARAEAEAEARHQESVKKLEESAVRRKEKLQERARHVHLTTTTGTISPGSVSPASASTTSPYASSPSGKLPPPPANLHELLPSSSPHVGAEGETAAGGGEGENISAAQWTGTGTTEQEKSKSNSKQDSSSPHHHHHHHQDQKENRHEKQEKKEAAESVVDPFTSKLSLLVQRHGKQYIETFSKEQQELEERQQQQQQQLQQTSGGGNEKTSKKSKKNNNNSENSNNTQSVLDDNKSRFNPILCKFSRQEEVLTRQTASELSRILTQTKGISESQDDHDHTVLRNHVSPVSVFQILSSSLVSFRGNKQISEQGNLSRAPFDLLHKLLLHPREGPKHLSFFCRSGQFAPLITSCFVDINNYCNNNHQSSSSSSSSSNSKKSNNNISKMSTSSLFAFRDELSLLQLCSHFFCVDDAQTSTSQPFRLILVDFLMKGVELEKMIAIMSEECGEHHQQPHETIMLEILQFVLMLYSLKISRGQQHGQMSEEDTSKHLLMLLTSLTHVLMPKGQLAKSLNPVGGLVVFTLLRLLNDLVRKNLSLTHKIFAEAASRQLVYHALSTFTQYVKQQQEEMENITNPSADVVKAAASDPGALSPTFLDAVDFGLAYITTQRPPLSSYSATVQQAQQNQQNQEQNHQQQQQQSKNNNECECRLRSALHEVLLFTGYICLNNTVMQDVFHYGMGSSLLIQLLECCPISYFGVAKHILLPTLLCVCFKNRRNISVLSQEYALDSLTDFLSEEISQRPSASKIHNKKNKNNNSTTNATSSGAAGGAVGAGDVLNSARSGATQTPRVQPESWADLEDSDPEDDDDDDDEVVTTGTASSASTSPQNNQGGGGGGVGENNATTMMMQSTPSNASFSSSVTTPPAGIDEIAAAAERKEKLTHGLSVLTSRYAFVHYFRLDKRFPISLWSEALAELKAQQERAASTPSN